jgi:hypothetical protein
MLRILQHIDIFVYAHFGFVSHNESSVHGHETFKTEEQNSGEDSGLVATFT